MEQANIIIYSNYTEINNITSLKEFNSNLFNVEINNELYIVKGSNLELKEVSSNNSSIKITGTVYLFEKKNHVKEKKNFIKRLFS